MEEALTEVQRDIIIGSLLGDGHLRKHRNRVVFEFLQTARRKFYVEWKHRMLGGLSLPKIYHYKGKREYYKLVTKAHPELDALYAKFYRECQKIVPEDVGKMLTPISVAVWFMDDGSKSRGAVYFNTQQFSIEDQFRLIKALKRFYIVANLNRDGQYYRLRVLKRCNQRLVELISSHILPEFAYKLPTP